MQITNGMRGWGYACSVPAMVCILTSLSRPGGVVRAEMLPCVRHLLLLSDIVAYELGSIVCVVTTLVALEKFRLALELAALAILEVKFAADVRFATRVSPPHCRRRPRLYRRLSVRAVACPPRPMT